MHITDPHAAEQIARRIRAFRRGNRLMTRADSDLHLTLYRRDEPDTKLGTVRLSGNGAFSVADAAVVAVTAIFALSLFSRIACILRHLR